MSPAGDGLDAALPRVGIRELRNQVAAVVRRAAAGERVVITVDGQPVAMLGPLSVGPEGPTIDDLVAAGLLVPPNRADHPPAPPDAATLPIDARSARALAEVRGD